MKKLIVAMLVCSFVLILPTAALGLYYPSVATGGGVIQPRYIENIGFALGCEFGFSSSLAICADLGENDFRQVGLKLQLNRNLALVGGVYGSEADPYFGFNGSAPILSNLLGMVQLQGVSGDSEDIYLVYEAGLKINLDRKFDIRFGVMGDTAADNLNFQAGMGITF